MSAGKRRRATRGEQQRASRARARLDPNQARKAILAAETGTIFADAPFRIGLCYPGPYRTAMSSLGYQVVYRMFNRRPGLATERIVLPDSGVRDERRWLRSIESGRPADHFDILAFSVAYEPDIAGFFELLSLAKIPALRTERTRAQPPVILGGPVTVSNPLPFGPFIDLAVVGEAEAAIPPLLDILESARDREELATRAAPVPGIWVPGVHGDAVVAAPLSDAHVLPTIGQIITPHTELSNMLLVEVSRGCPRFCKFCLARAANSPMRQASVDAVIEAADQNGQAPRIGFVGAAVSEWPGIRQALEHVIASGKGAGVSSLRADRLDAELVGLLARAGYKTMTVASDAPSQRLRNTAAKAIQTRHLVEAARLASDAGMVKLKLYVVVGLPGEGDDDIAELIALSEELSGYLPVTLAISPLVPKLHTPWGDASFAGVDEIDRTLRSIRHKLRGRVEVRSTSGRWAWVEYRLSQGAEDAGLAAQQAHARGGGFKAYARAFEAARERGALEAARRHGLWLPAGMR